MKTRDTSPAELVRFHRESAAHHKARAEAARRAMRRELDTMRAHKAAVLRIEKETK